MSDFFAWIDTLDVLGWWVLAAIVVGLLAEPFCRVAAKADEDKR